MIWPADRPPQAWSLRDLVSFVNNVPAPAAVINQLITDLHADIAERLAEAIYANVDRLDPADVRPTFAAHGHWASAEVGRQLRFPLPSGRRRRARALLDGNRDVAFTVGQAATRLLEGRSFDDLGAANRDLIEGFECYRAAAATFDLNTKARLILEGNERVVTYEQTLLEGHLGVAFRITARRATSPIDRFRTSQREWRRRDPGRWRLRLEGAIARLATAMVAYRVPDRRYRAWRGVGDAARPRCWMCFDDRVPWIVATFRDSHADRWFEAGDSSSARFRLRRTRRWKHFDRAWARFRDEYLLGFDEPVPVPDQTAALRRAAADTPPAPASDTPVGLASAADWQRAAAFYRSHRPEVLVALMTRSIPATFSSPEGAPVLDPHEWTPHDDQGEQRRLIDDGFPRIARTLGFVDSMFDEATDARVPALEAARARHSVVRTALGSVQPVAINDEHMLATATTFVCEVREMFDEFGFGGADGDWDSWARVWAEIAVWLGADVGYVRSEMNVGHTGLGGYELMDRIAQRIDRDLRARSVAGVRLLDSFVGDLSDGFPRVARSVPAIAMWTLGDPQSLRRLMLAPSFRGRLGRRVALRAARAPRPVRALWRWVRARSADWILAELASAGDAEAYDPTYFFPPDCRVTELGQYRPRSAIPLRGANPGGRV